MKHYIPHWESIGITKERYLELLHFCRQYPDWKAESSSLLGMHGQSTDGLPHGSQIGDPVWAAVYRRAGIQRKIDIIEKCATAVSGGKWYSALILNVCMARPYSQLDPCILPSSDRNSFFQARKEFFIRLDAIQGGDAIGTQNS